MNKKLILIIGLVVLVVAVPLIQARVRGTASVEVEVEKLEPRVIQSSVLASGKLVHEEEVKLSTEEIGRVTAIYVDEGQKVARGELVLQIDDQRLRAAVDQQEASVRMQEIAIQRQQLQVDNLRTQWNRMQGLHERNLIDEDSFDTASNNLEIAEVDLMSSRESLEQARANLEQQEDRLSKTRVYSPIDGTVTTLDIKVGETAISSSTNIPGSSLMTIANPASIHTEVNVDEADIANVEIGQMARVFAIAYPDQPVDGVVESIAVSAKVAEGQQGQSFAIKIRLLDPEKITLRPGMTCRAEIFTATKGGVLAAPIQAILVEEDLTTDEVRRDVFVNRNGACREVAVEVGIADDTYQEIVSGLSAGDEVVTGPDRVLRALEDGDRIVVAESDRATQQRQPRHDRRGVAPMPVIELNSISKHYEMGQQLIKAVDNLDLTIDYNEYIVFIGSSGSGKSTLMNIIGCLDTPTSGRYVLNEQDVSGMEENELADIRNQEIGFIFQSFNLLPRASALKNVMQPLIYRGMSPAERKAEAERVLERVGLAERSAPLAEPAFGRPTAARRHRARARHEPVDPARRRADRQSRFADEHRDPRVVRRAAQRRPDHHRRHARARRRGAWAARRAPQGRQSRGGPAQ